MKIIARHFFAVMKRAFVFVARVSPGIIRSLLLMNPEGCPLFENYSFSDMLKATLLFCQSNELRFSE
jgi:hypothetical protein